MKLTSYGISHQKKVGNIDNQIGDINREQHCDPVMIITIFGHIISERLTYRLCFGHTVSFDHDEAQQLDGQQQEEQVLRSAVSIHFEGLQIADHAPGEQQYGEGIANDARE